MYSLQKLNKSVIIGVFSNKRGLYTRKHPHRHYERVVYQSLLAAVLVIIFERCFSPTYLVASAMLKLGYGMNIFTKVSPSMRQENNLGTMHGHLYSYSYLGVIYRSPFHIPTCLRGGKKTVCQGANNFEMQNYKGCQ